MAVKKGGGVLLVEVVVARGGEAVQRGGYLRF
jgi:hypothetical protein